MSEEVPDPPPAQGELTGVDLRIKALAIQSDGVSYDNPKALEQTPEEVTERYQWARLAGPLLMESYLMINVVSLLLSTRNPFGFGGFLLKPAADAAFGDPFTLEVTLAGLRLERVGAID